MAYIKNQILQNNALEAWAILEYRKHFVSALHNAVELQEISIIPKI